MVCRVDAQQMLFEALQCLGPDDVLLLDRGYPAAWLVAYLTENNIRFCMRCDTPSGCWKAVRSFVQSGQADAIVTLSKPTAKNAADYLCSGVAPQLRLVRCTTPDGQIRVLATNLAASNLPAEGFVELYHKRWRIEEAFKRLKHQMKLESVSGLTQYAVLLDVHAKVLADNLASLVCMGAAQVAELDSAKRICNRSYASRCLQRLIPRMVMGLGYIATLLDKAFSLLGANSNRVVPGRSSPRNKSHVKPHPNLAYKG